MLMGIKVSSSELQGRFGQLHDAAMKAPVEIESDGRVTAYLVSAETFRQMWDSYRRSFYVEDLTDEEMARITAARVPEDLDWDADDAASPAL